MVNDSLSLLFFPSCVFHPVSIKIQWRDLSRFCLLFSTPLLEESFIDHDTKVGSVGRRVSAQCVEAVRKNGRAVIMKKWQLQIDKIRLWNLVLSPTYHPCGVGALIYLRQILLKTNDHLHTHKSVQKRKKGGDYNYCVLINWHLVAVFLVFLVVQYRLFCLGSTRERRVKTCKKIYSKRPGSRVAFQDSIQDRYKQCMYIWLYICVHPK